MKHHLSDRAMIDITNDAKFDTKTKKTGQGSSVVERRKKEHINKTLFDVPTSSILASYKNVIRASKIMRTTTPDVFKFTEINGGGMIPFETAIPILLNLMLVETDGPQNYLRVHKNHAPGEPLNCGMLLFWDESDTDFAQGHNNHFVDLFLKFTNFYTPEVCLYVFILF